MNRGPLDMKDIECPVCFNLMEPPIYMCENGHGMCDNCKPKLADCPVCRGKLMDERKHDAEMLSRSIKHRCIFQTSGCTKMFFLTEKKIHEKRCLYRYRECPLGSAMCEEEVDPADAKDHILEAHADLITHRPLNITSELTWPSVSGKIFNKVLVKGDGVFIVNVREGLWEDIVVSCTYVGSPDDARKFKYMLTLYGEESYRTLSYTSRCLSYLELLGREKNANNCIFLPKAVFQEFLSPAVSKEGYRTLTYEIEVDKI